VTPARFAVTSLYSSPTKTLIEEQPMPGFARNKNSRIVVLVALLTVLPACNGFLKPHKMPIQQGNVITKEMLQKLKVGMKPSQVKYVLGTPLVVDTFDANRWFYLYTLRMPNGDKLRQKLAIVFNDGKLASFDNDYQFDIQDRPAKANPDNRQGDLKDKPGNEQSEDQNVEQSSSGA
ncbi:MAG: outer membrane protein assembly factor BamE, partial [Pseudomonadales bacterium]|nr:outer membrane protein assembly factor BamE [Pseudomonadales bacterium]